MAAGHLPLLGPAADCLPAAPSWEGLSSNIGKEPPDPHGAAGPQGILSVSNLRIAYYSKSGNGIYVRGQASGTPDASLKVAAYALGG